MSDIRRYRHKPTEIRAVRWTGDNLEQVLLLTGDSGMWHVSERTLYVDTTSGPVPVQVGHYVARGPYDVYPISQEALFASYDEVDPQVEGQLTLPGM